MTTLSRPMKRTPCVSSWKKPFPVLIWIGKNMLGSTRNTNVLPKWTFDWRRIQGQGEVELGAQGHLQGTRIDHGRGGYEVG